MRRLVGRTLSGAPVLLLLAACGGGGPNAVERDYAAQVVSHHAQTIALLDLTLGRDNLDPRLGAYADRTRTELFSEVDAAEKRLERWGEPVPQTALEHAHDQDGVTYDTSIPGVLSNDVVHSLETTTGRSFQGAWLRRLVSHERGAVRLARRAVGEGENAAAIAAAQQDLEAHQHRVATLEGLLAR